MNRQVVDAANRIIEYQSELNNGYQCECGRVLGERCNFNGPFEYTVLVEIVVACNRDQHRKVGGFSEMIRAYWECADIICEGDEFNKWAGEIGE